MQIPEKEANPHGGNLLDWTEKSDQSVHKAGNSMSWELEAQSSSFQSQQGDVQNELSGQQISGNYSAKLSALFLFIVKYIQQTYFFSNRNMPPRSHPKLYVELVMSWFFRTNTKQHCLHGEEVFLKKSFKKGRSVLFLQKRK